MTCEFLVVFHCSKLYTTGVSCHRDMITSYEVYLRSRHFTGKHQSFLTAKETTFDSKQIQEAKLSLE